MDHRCDYRYRQAWTDYRPKQGVLVSEKVKIRECQECGNSGQVSRLPVVRRSYCPPEVDRPDFLEAEEKDLSLLILRLLYQKKNSVGYRVLVQDLTRRGFTFQRIEEAVERLYRGGWLLRQEKRAAPSRWEVHKIEIPAERWEEAREVLGIAAWDWSELLEKLSSLPGEEAPSPVAERLRAMLLEQYEQLGRGAAELALEGEAIASTRRPEKYRLLMETLWEIYGVSRNRGRISFRSLAQLVSGDSKGLAPYKRELEFLLGAELREAGVFDHSDLCCVSGWFNYEVRGSKGSGKSGYPYVVLTEETVAEMVITAAPPASLLLVENLTVFEESLRRGYYQRPDVVVLYSQGYISQVQVLLLHKLLASGSLNRVYVWADPDPFGVNIFKDIKKRLAGAGVPVRSLLMDRVSLQRLPVTKPLETADLALLAAPVPAGLPAELLELWRHFSQSGRKGEQEGFLEVMTDEELLNLVPASL